MICYRDMTFCTMYRECKKGENCDRALTDYVIAQAVKWWGDIDPPIAQYVDEPECFNHV